MEKLSIHFAATQETIETIFSHNRFCKSAQVFAEQSREMCEEYEPFHDRSGRPEMVMGQSIVLSAIQTEVSLDCDDTQNL